jgi:hypothetical protein
MNGTKLIEDHWKSKESAINKKFRLKLLLSLLISNSFIYVLCYTSPSNEKKTVVEWYRFKNKLNKRMIISTLNFIDANELTSSKAVTIYTQNNKKLIEEAWLHGISKQEKKSLCTQISLSRFEIKREDISKLTNTDLSKLKVFPFHIRPPRTSTPKRNSYEFIF